MRSPVPPRGNLSAWAVTLRCHLEGQCPIPGRWREGSLIFQSLHFQDSLFSPVVSDGLPVATLPGPVTLLQMLGLHVAEACGYVWQGHVAGQLWDILPKQLEKAITFPLPDHSV